MITTAIIYLFVLSFLGTVVGGCCCTGGTNPYDTGQTCCATPAGGKYCCISDQSTMDVGPLPAISYSGGPGPTDDLVNWYSTNYAGTTVSLPIVPGSCSWQLDVTSGDFTITFVASLTAFQFGFISTTTGGINPKITTITHADCCGFTGNNWIDVSGTFGVTITNTANTGTVMNNNCCQDTLHGNSGGPCDNTMGNCGCLKNPTNCDGSCNFLP